MNNYPPRSKKYIEAKDKLLGNAKNFYKVREKTVEGFREGIFLLKSDDEFGEEYEGSIAERTKLRRQRLDKIKEKNRT